MLLLACLSLAAESASKDALAKEIIRSLGYVESYRKAMDAQVEMTIAQTPGLPAKVVDELRASVKPERLLDVLVHSWGNAFTEQELKEIRTISKSATGKKLLMNWPQIVERMSGAAALQGVESYKILNRFDPVRYPIPEQAKQALRQLERQSGEGK